MNANSKTPIQISTILHHRYLGHASSIHVVSTTKSDLRFKEGLPCLQGLLRGLAVIDQLLVWVLVVVGVSLQSPDFQSVLSKEQEEELYVLFLFEEREHQ